MSIPLKHMNTERPPLSAAMRLAAAKPARGSQTARKFPRRPHLNVLSETIPLFYICQNRHGFWVARDSEGRSGGLFLRKDAALRFARKNSEPVGCAMMLLAESIELDIENKGNRIAVPFDRRAMLSFERLCDGYAGSMIGNVGDRPRERQSALALCVEQDLI